MDSGISFKNTTDRNDSTQMWASLTHAPSPGPQEPGDLPRGENSKPPPKGSAAEKESDRDKEEKKGVQENREEEGERREEPLREREQPTREREGLTRDREESTRKREEPTRKREEPMREREESMREREESMREREGSMRKREEPMEVEVPRGGGVSPSRGALWQGEDLALMRRGLEHREDPGELQLGPRHTVLINLPDFKKDKKLRPQPGSNLWNSDHVKMPNSTRNTFNKQGMFGSDEKLRWDLIKKKLSKLSNVTKSETIEEVIKSYNVNYKNEWKFDALHKYFETEEPKCELFRVVKATAELALKLPDICPKAIPLLKQGMSHSLTLSQEQISCLLANAFFCTFPHRNSTQPRAEYSNYPDINFNRLFGESSKRKQQKLKTIFHYFKSVTEEPPQGLVTFERRSLAGRCDWKHCDSKISKLHITSKGTIEKDGKGMLQVDFACAMVGGGVLGSGLVQEEIRFLTHTELIVSRLFTEKLGDWDALCITGPQCYSEYSGYSDTYSWEGPHTDTTERDRWMRRCTKIIAIDAIKFKNEQQQFEMRNVDRELNKAYCGFEPRVQAQCYLPVATGNWGCGAFNGDSKLKALIQMMAASKASRDIVYFTFGNKELVQEIWNMHNFLQKQHFTVGKLYSVLEKYCERKRSRSAGDLYDFIYHSYADLKSKH
ncbi:poly(ADP-ribose) glycohydrolase isoform X1 [Acipenser oxyrinchus oxyrinchus]|uniref:poly(ADP-ribose) glycohydrolase n=1 Tax=Acipenser oxyrinchus oxyrinchus TaxID=40147 RepID=A0AAD8FR16_ACIOX|nr:poly(ADP-ribose) glycohydrolase isoform X1 [Acipenser oxyrinchus oxyrinchus]